MKITGVDFQPKKFIAHENRKKRFMSWKREIEPDNEIHSKTKKEKVFRLDL